MKKYIVLIMLALALPVLTTPPAFADQATALQESSVFSDLYGLRRTQEMTVISPDDAVNHSFYGLKSAIKKVTS